MEENKEILAEEKKEVQEVHEVAENEKPTLTGNTLYYKNDFKIDLVYREITDDMLEAMVRAEEVSEEYMKNFNEKGGYLAIRIESITGVWTVEFPVFTKMFNIIYGLVSGENDKELKTLLYIMLHACINLGDKQFLNDVAEAEKTLFVRNANQTEEEDKE